jgi:hypothetical protein
MVAAVVTTALLLGASGCCPPSTGGPNPLPARVNTYARFVGNIGVLAQLGELGGCMQAFSDSGRTHFTQREKRCISTGAGLLGLLGSGLAVVAELLPEPYREVLTAPATVLVVAVAALNLLAADPPDPNYSEPVQVAHRTVTLTPGPLDATEFAAVRDVTRVVEWQAAYAKAEVVALNRAATAEQADAYGYARSRARQARAFAHQLAGTLPEERTQLRRLQGALRQDNELNDSPAAAVSADQVASGEQRCRSSGHLPAPMDPYLTQLGADTAGRARILDVVSTQDPTRVAALGTAPATARIASNTGGAHLRLDPTASSDSRQYLRNGTAVTILCDTVGERVDPPHANYSSRRWLEVQVVADSTIGYLHSSLADRHEDAPDC